MNNSSTSSSNVEINIESNESLKFKIFLLDIDQASINLNYDFYIEDNEALLFKSLTDSNISNGLKLISYAKLGLKFKDYDKTGKRNARKTIEDKIERNGTRTLRIASRTYQLFEIIGDFPICEFKRITPKWLFSLTNSEFETFLELCRKGNESVCFAGAQI